MSSTMELKDLNRELERTKAKVFIDSNAAFLGSLACSMEVFWDSTIESAETDGVSIWWNPEWFSQISPAHRVTVYVHELWHPARLHFLRRGTRDARDWNRATDYIINNDMKDAGYDFNGLPCLLNPDYRGMAEEQVYEIIHKDNPNPGDEFMRDMREPTEEGKRTIINNVVRAYHQAKAAGKEGNLPGSIKEVINTFLASVINWQQALDRFFSELVSEDYSWAKPNRRYPDMYLPCRYQEAGKLAKLNYYLDVSGSITKAQIIRFNSEVKVVKDTYNPEEMNLIQFDIQIQKEETVYENDQFNQIEVSRGGATSLHCVREHMLKTKPTAAVIFTDLHCNAMQKLPFDIPIVWIVINHKGATVPFGEAIYINE